MNEAALRTIVSIESEADRGRPTPGRHAGLFQMDRDAARAAGYRWEDLNRPDQWQTNVRAGVAYLNLNARGLQNAGVEPTPLNIYIAHQQGLNGATRILRAVEDGSARREPAGRNQVRNMWGFQGVAGRLTLQDYYDYVSAAFRAVNEQVNPPNGNTPGTPD